MTENRSRVYMTMVLVFGGAGLFVAGSLSSCMMPMMGMMGMDEKAPLSEVLRHGVAWILVSETLFAVMRIADSAYVPWLREFQSGQTNMYERAAAHLRSRLGPGETVFVVNDQPVLYMLTRVKPPTPYVFPDHLFGEFGAAYAGIDRESEIRRVLSGRPAYITIQDGDGAIERGMREAIAPEYREENRFDSLVLYRWCGGPCGSQGP